MPVVKWSRKTKLSRLLRECGPITLLTKEEYKKLKPEDERRVLLIDQTSSDTCVYGHIGFGIVNVDQRYILSKPAPEPVAEVYDIWWGDSPETIPDHMQH